MPHILVKLGDKIVKNFPVTSDIISIGRARDNDIVLENLSVSRNHARIRREGEQLVLIDLNSANGIFVNGVRVSRAELVDGDIVSIGKHRLHYFEQSASAAAAEAAGSSAAVPMQTAGASASRTGVPLPRGSGLTAQPSAVMAVPDDMGRVAAGELVAVLEVTLGKQAGRAFALSLGENSIGRHNCDIRLHDLKAARKHAMIEFTNGGFYLRDLGSWQGTTVNGEKIKEKQLRPGDEVRLGTTMLKFLVGEPAEFAAKLEAPSPEPVAVPPRSSDQVALPRPSQVAAAKLAIEEMQEEEEEPIKVSSKFDEKEPEPEPVALEASPNETPQAEDDEFAPMTDEELADLEREADDAFVGIEDEEKARQAEWEQIEAERMLAGGGGLDIGRHGSLVESDEELSAQESAAIPKRSDAASALMEDPETNSGGRTSMDAIDLEEEKSLFAGPVEDVEPQGRRAEEAPRAASTTPVPEPAAPQAAVAWPKSGGKAAPAPKPAAPSKSAVPKQPGKPAPADKPSPDSLPVPEGVDPAEFKRWIRGLKNKNKVVRKEAARKLKDLTGQEYDWESEP